MKKYRSFFLLAMLLLMGLAACRNETSNQKTPDLLKLVPSRTAAIIKTKDLAALAQKLESNNLISENPELPINEFFNTIYSPIKSLEIKGNSLLTFTRIGKDEIATGLITSSLPRLQDSIPFEKVGSFTYNGEEVTEYNLDNKSIYAANLKNSFVFGDSKLVIENMIRLSKEKIDPDQNLSKLYQSTSGKDVVFINTPQFHDIYRSLMPRGNAAFLKNFANWSALDLNVASKSIRLSGVSIPERNEILGIFSGTKPRKNELEKITPTSADGFYSFTFDDFSTIENNLSFYHKEEYTSQDTDLYSSIHEIGQIFLKNRNVLVLKSVNNEDTDDWLQQYQEKPENFRGHTIYKFSKADYFTGSLQPLISPENYHYFTKIGEFYVFGADQNLIENIISNAVNKTLLSESESYVKTKKHLDDKSSVLLVGLNKNLIKTIGELTDKKHEEAFKQMRLGNYNYAALQFINHDNFTYTNGIISDSEMAAQEEGGVELERIKPGEKITSGPWFFINWRTNHHDIVFQGESNTLYVYNEKGDLRWKKQLDGRILGDIQPIDIYQNKRIQMAFVTPQTFYILDREGNVVKPFEKTFKADITQPLAIFDYNNNGNFRFIVVQNNHLTMLDKQLNAVKGFEFTTAKSRVLQAPKHFRMGNKDYIVIPEESGQLNILNPRGQTRVNVKEKIDFSDNEWYLHQNRFTSTNKKGQLIQITPQAVLNQKDLKLDKENHQIDATAKNMASLSGNKLKINDKSATLEYGDLTSPKIFYLNDKMFYNVSDVQNHRVYLFDSNAKLLPGFPVYGNSAVDIQNMDNQGGLELVVKGEEDSILIYALDDE